MIDIVPYLSTMDWEAGFSSRQSMFDSNYQELQINPFEGATVIYSPSEHAVLVFKSEFFADR